MPPVTALSSQALPAARSPSRGSIPGAMAGLIDTLRTSNAELNVTARALIADHRALRVELFQALRRAELAEAELVALKAQPPVLRRRERKNSRSKPETRTGGV